MNQARSDIQSSTLYPLAADRWSNGIDQPSGWPPAHNNEKGIRMERVTDERLRELVGFFDRMNDPEVVNALSELLEVRGLVERLEAKLKAIPPAEAAKEPERFDTDGSWPPPLRRG